jgi:hypothetical protein
MVVSACAVEGAVKGTAAMAAAANNNRTDALKYFFMVPHFFVFRMHPVIPAVGSAYCLSERASRGRSIRIC